MNFLRTRGLDSEMHMKKPTRTKKCESPEKSQKNRGSSRLKGTALG